MLRFISFLFVLKCHDTRAHIKWSNGPLRVFLFINLLNCLHVLSNIKGCARTFALRASFRHMDRKSRPHFWTAFENKQLLTISLTNMLFWCQKSVATGRTQTQVLAEKRIKRKTNIFLYENLLEHHSFRSLTRCVALFLRSDVFWCVTCRKCNAVTLSTCVCVFTEWLNTHTHNTHMHQLKITVVHTSHRPESYQGWTNILEYPKSVITTSQLPSNALATIHIPPASWQFLYTMKECSHIWFDRRSLASHNSPDLFVLVSRVSAE